MDGPDESQKRATQAKTEADAEALRLYCDALKHGQLERADRIKTAHPHLRGDLAEIWLRAAEKWGTSRRPHVKGDIG